MLPENRGILNSLRVLFLVCRCPLGMGRFLTYSFCTVWFFTYGWSFLLAEDCRGELKGTNYKGQNGAKIRRFSKIFANLCWLLLFPGSVKRIWEAKIFAENHRKLHFAENRRKPMNFAETLLSHVAMNHVTKGGDKKLKNALQAVF